MYAVSPTGVQTKRCDFGCLQCAPKWNGKTLRLRCPSSALAPTIGRGGKPLAEALFTFTNSNVTFSD